jgi:hypothetical protein
VALSALQDQIDKARKKQEEADRAKAKAVSTMSRAEKDDVYVPPKAKPAQDDRQQAIQEHRADKASIKPTPTAPKITQPQKTYLPIVSNNQPQQPQQPQRQYGPPAPEKEHHHSEKSPVANALQSWQTKPSAPTFSHDTPNTAPQIGLGFERPDTNAPGVVGQPQQASILQPFDPDRFKQPTQAPIVDKPANRTFLQANALAQPFGTASTAGNLAAVQQVGPVLGNAAANYLKSWNPQTTIDAANQKAKGFGLDWQNPATVQQPAVQQPQIISGLQRPDTGAPSIGAGGQPSGTLPVNVATPQTPIPSDGKGVMDWYKQTPSGLANIPKFEEAGKRGGFLANLETIGAGLNIPFQLASQTPIPGSGALTGGQDVSAGQVGSAVGTVVNRAVNPFSDQSIWRNAANFQTPSVVKNADALQNPQQAETIQQAMLNQPPTVADAVGGWIKDTFTNNLNKSVAINTYLSTLPPEEKTKASIALNNVWSGPWSVQKTVDDILGQDKRVADYKQQAQAAQAIAQNPATPPDQAAAAALKAAQLGKQAQEEASYSAVDYVDKDKHPGPELVADLLFNPINHIPGPEKAIEFFKDWRLARAFNITTEEANKILPKALGEADKILAKYAVQGAEAAKAPLVDAGKSASPALARTMWEKINPLAPTLENKAQKSTDVIWNSVAQLVGGATTKQDAQILVKTFIENPLKLVNEGVTGLASPALQAVSDQGLYKVGASVVANRPLLNELPIVKLAADKILQLPELSGEGAFVAKDFMAALDGTLYETAREAFGGGAITKLPAGAVTSKLRYLGDGTAVIDYLDAAKKVVSSSAPQVAYDAEQAFKSIAKGATGGGAITQATNALDFTWKLQKGIISDMYLALNPASWIRNGSSAAAHLNVDGIGALHPQKDMLSSLTRKLDVIPERGLAAAVGGYKPDFPHWSEAIFGKDNLYAKFVKGAQDIRGGLTTLPGTGGTVNMGEDAYRLQAFFNGFQRTFKRAWEMPVKEVLGPGLKELGIADDVVSNIVNHAVDAGVNGSKAEMANTVRNVLNQATIKPSLRELGIPDELVSMQGWKDITDIIGGHLPEQADEAAIAIQQAFTDELTHRAGILNESPRQLGNYKWTDVEATHDSAALIDNLKEAGKNANVPAEQVEQTVTELTKKLDEVNGGAWQAFRTDLASAQQPKDALNMAVDVWAKHNQLKQEARAAVDELSRAAVATPAPEAWAQKWQGTQQIYEKLAQDTGALFQNARARLNGVAGPDAAAATDWWKAIERFTTYDEAAVQAERTAGMDLNSPLGNQEQWNKTIGAGRQYLDKSMLELYDAYRRNPTQTSLDMLVHAQQKVEEMGAQVAAYLKPLRDEAMQTRQWGTYYAERNAAWGQYFDNAVLHNKATQRYVIGDGVSKEYEKLLSWEDPFYGPLRAIAPGTDQTVNASADAQRMMKMNTGTKQPRVTEYSIWKVADEKGEIIDVPKNFIPDNVQAAWEKIVNHDDIVNSVMDDIGKTVQPAEVANVAEQALPAATPAATKWDPYMLGEGETVQKVLADNTSKSLAQNANKAPEVSEVMGSHMIAQLKAAEQKILAQLPELLAGKPNTLTEAQRLGASDLLNTLMGHFDNATMQASKGAQDGMNFAMLNYNDKRNIDTVLGYAFPYHYYYTRSAINWAQRAFAKPAIINMYNRVNQAIAEENKQSQLPARLEGTVPNPAAQFGVGPDRLGNPLTWLLPLASFSGNQYVDEADAQSDFEKWYMRIKKFTPSMAPALEAATAAAFDKSNPLPNGEKRFDPANYAPQKFIPGMNIAGEAVQAVTGRTAAQLPGGMGPTFGDKFDPYRLGRKAAELAMQQKIDPSIAQYAQQIALNQQTGKDPFDKIPTEFQQAAQSLYTEAAKGAAKDRLWSDAGRFFTGVPGYNFSDQEKQMQQAQGDVYKLGYSPDNPYGSKQAMNEQRAQNPYLQPWSTKSALVPSADPKYQPMEPAVGAQNTAKSADKDAIQSKMNSAVETYLKANPTASTKDVMAIKQPFLDQVKALDTKYPDAGYPEGAGGPPKGMNPQERAQWQLDQLLYGSGAGGPQKPENATPEQLQAYYKAKADFVQTQLDQIETSAGGVFTDQGEPTQEWQTAFKSLTKGKYAIELLHELYLRDVSKTEQEWSKRNDLQNELTGAQMQGNVDNVKARLGDKVAALFDQYRQLPKDGDAREKFKAAHPELAMANIAAYDPDKYDQAIKQFGPNAWKVYAGKPTYPGDNATEGQKAQYKTAMANYEAHNPQYGQIKLWVDGRPRKFEPAPAGMVSQRNYGQDYTEAVKIFGPNIFKVVANYPSGADKKTVALYYKAHPELSGYWQWYNEVKNQPPNYVAANAGGAVNLDGYQGPRPIGSDRQPIGLAPGEKPPAGWDVSALTSGQPTLASETGGGAASTTTKTAGDYIAASDADYQAKYFKEHGYYPGKSPKAAAYAAARNSLAKEFGADAVGAWEAYGKLPKGSKAREEYKAAHPELRAYDMAAYNPTEYAEAKKVFGDNAWMEWAQAPKSGETDEEKAARSAYFDEHPTAKLLNAWVNGRPSERGEQAPGEGIKYDFGKDYTAAQKMFGDDIWKVFGEYKSGFDKNQKRAFFNEHPALTKFFDWWYGNDSKGGTYARGKGFGGGYSRGYGGGGGYSYGGWGGGGGDTGPGPLSHAKVEGRGLSEDLFVQPDSFNQLRQWRPQNIDLSWMHAGDMIGPDKLKTWKR